MLLLDWRRCSERYSMLSVYQNLKRQKEINEYWIFHNMSPLTSPVCFMQDKWLLHSVLMLVQSWMEPLIYLQTTLSRYDDAPDALLNKTKWVSDKLLSLEQGVLVLIRKVNQ